MKKLALFITIAFGIASNAQQYQGNFVSGYSGAIGVQYNPATFVHKRPNWDINLVGVGATIYSQYGYISDESILSMTSKETIENASDSLPTGFNATTDALFFAEDHDNPFTSLYFDAITHLPSFTFKVKTMSFGLFTNMRSNWTAMNSPAFFDYYNLKDVVEDSNHIIAPFQTAGMLWGEIGINVAKRFEVGNGNSLSIGVNPKYLVGFEGGFAENITQFHFKRSNDTINASAVNGRFGFASGASRETEDYNFGVHGSGFGIDIGAEYAITKVDYEEEKVPYKLKFGGAIRDLGFINFNKNTEVHNYSIDSIEKIAENISDNKNHNYDIIQRISHAVYGDSSASLTATDFDMYLPTSINLHVDYNMIDFLFVNAYLQRRMSIFTPQVNAPNILMVGARYERRWLELGVNSSLMEDKWFGLGAYIRLGLLTIGSDHLGSFLFSQPKLNGADVYMSFRILPFGKGNKEDEGAGRFGGSGRKGDYGCYKF